MQSFCENLIDNQKGSIIISNPENGEILTLFSFPDYDLNSFAGPISYNKWKELNNSNDNIFLNRSIQSTYPPG